MAIRYSPRSYFFTEHDKIADADGQFYADDAFGPVSGSETSKYRLTSWVRAKNPSEKVKVFAVTRGRILIVPCGDGKVNLVQRVGRSIDPSFPLRYIIYRGIDASDLIGGDKLVVPTGDSCTLLSKIWDAYRKYHGDNVAEIPAGEIGYKTYSSESVSLDECFFNLLYSGECTCQLPMAQPGDWIGCFSGRMGVDMVLDAGNAVPDIEKVLFPINMGYASAGCGMLDTDVLAESGLAETEMEGVGRRYRESVLKFMDVAAFYGSHLGCGKISVKGMDAEISITMKDTAQIYINVLSKFQTRHKIYLYVWENRGVPYSYNDDEANRRRLYFGESGAGHIPNELYGTDGWYIHIREMAVSGSVPVKCSCVLQSFVEESVDESYRTVSLDVLSTNADGAYPAICENTGTGISDMKPVSVTLYPHYPSAGSYHLCSSFVMLKGVLRVENYGANVTPTYSCLWKADIKSPVNASQSQLAIVSSRHSGMSEAPIMLQHTIFEQHGSVGLRLYTSMKNNGFQSVENAAAPLEEMVINEDSELTSEDYFRHAFGSADFSIYKGKVEDHYPNGPGLNSLCIVNAKCIAERNRWYMLGITEDEYGMCIGELKDSADCSSIYFALNEVMDEQTLKSFYHKYELMVLYDTPQGKNVIIPETDDKTVYIYTLDRHIFFSEKYVASSKFNINASSDIAIHFRPCENYDKEYGIDWLRIGEDGVDGGAEYELSVIGGRDMGNDKDKAYKSLRSEYECLFTNTIYYVPYLRLFPKQYSDNHKAVYNTQSIQPPYKANIRLLIKDTHIQYSYFLKFGYDHTLFTIGDLDNNDCMTLTDGTDKTIEIECHGAFTCDQTISAWLQMPDGSKLIGAINVRANNVVTDRDIHIFQIETKVDDTSSKTEQGVIYDDEIMSLYKFCYQGFINPTLHFGNISLIDDSRFKINGEFITVSNGTPKLSCSSEDKIKDLFDALNKALNKRLSENTDSNSIVYIFQLAGTVERAEGFTQEIDIPYSVMLNRLDNGMAMKRRNNAMAHEFFHGLGLRHTFLSEKKDDEKPKYYFDKVAGITATYNLMSYENDNIKYLWDWQIIEITN